MDNYELRKLEATIRGLEELRSRVMEHGLAIGEYSKEDNHKCLCLMGHVKVMMGLPPDKVETEEEIGIMMHLFRPLSLNTPSDVVTYNDITSPWQVALDLRTAIYALKQKLKKAQRAPHRAS